MRESSFGYWEENTWLLYGVKAPLVAVVGLLSSWLVVLFVVVVEVVLLDVAVAVAVAEEVKVGIV